MRSFWGKVGVPLKRMSREETDKRPGRSCGKMEAEIRVMFLQVREQQRSPETTRTWGRAGESISLTASGRTNPAVRQHLDLELPGCRTGCNQSLFLKLPSVWCFVRAAPGHEYRSLGKKAWEIQWELKHRVRVWRAGWESLRRSWSWGSSCSRWGTLNQCSSQGQEGAHRVLPWWDLRESRKGKARGQEPFPVLGEAIHLWVSVQGFGVLQGVCYGCLWPSVWFWGPDPCWLAKPLYVFWGSWPMCDLDYFCETSISI